MDIQKAVLYQYPNAVYGRDFNVGVDVSGNQFITQWSLAGVSVPTADQLNAWWLGYLRSQQKSTISAAYNAVLAAGFASTTFGKSFKCDLATFAKYIGEYTFLQANADATPYSMRATDGTLINPTRDQFFAFAAEAREFIASCEAKEWAKDTLINAVSEDIIPSVLWGCPTIPTGLAGTPGDGQVALTWTANPDTDVAKYSVYCNGALVSSPTSPALTVTNLTNGTKYNFTVSAVDSSGGESAQCEPITVTPQAAQS